MALFPGILADGSLIATAAQIRASLVLATTDNVVFGSLGLGGSAVSRLSVPIAPTGSANFGLVSLGSGPFDGSTSGFFVGSSSGTLLAGNAASGFAGNLIDLQIAGSPKFVVTSGGVLGLGTATPTALATTAVRVATAGHIYVNNNFGFVSVNASGTGIGAGIDSGTDDTLNLLAKGANVAHLTSLSSIGRMGVRHIPSADSAVLTSKGGGTTTGRSLDLRDNSDIGVVDVFDDGRVYIYKAPPGNIRGGLLSLGVATAFDGATAGNFSGSINGTFFAINAASGFAGSLVDLQIAGITKHKIDSTTITIGDGMNYVFNTSTGTKFGTATGQKMSWWNATPVVQQVLATGAGATVDNVISLLQTLGLCKQS